MHARDRFRNKCKLSWYPMWNYNYTQMNTFRLNRVLEFSMSFELNVFKIWVVKLPYDILNVNKEQNAANQIHNKPMKIRCCFFFLSWYKKFSKIHLIYVVCSIAEQTINSWSLSNSHITCFRWCWQSVSHWIGKILPKETNLQN